MGGGGGSGVIGAQVVREGDIGSRQQARCLLDGGLASSWLLSTARVGWLVLLAAAAAAEAVRLCWWLCWWL